MPTKNIEITRKSKVPRKIEVGTATPLESAIRILDKELDLFGEAIEDTRIILHHFTRNEIKDVETHLAQTYFIQSIAEFKGRFELHIVGRLIQSVKEIPVAEIPSTYTGSIEVYINPATAPPSSVAALLAKISMANRRLGGPGITFVPAGIVKETVEEEV